MPFIEALGQFSYRVGKKVAKTSQSTVAFRAFVLILLYNVISAYALVRTWEFLSGSR